MNYRIIDVTDINKPEEIFHGDINNPIIKRDEIQMGSTYYTVDRVIHKLTKILSLNKDGTKLDEKTQMIDQETVVYIRREGQT